MKQMRVLLYWNGSSRFEIRAPRPTDVVCWTFGFGDGIEDGDFRGGFLEDGMGLMSGLECRTCVYFGS